MSDSVTPWTAAYQASLSITNSLPVHPNPCPLSQWCHPTVSSVIPLSSCCQSFPASGSFPMSQFFASGGQSIGVSASASVLPLDFHCRRQWHHFSILALRTLWTVWRTVWEGIAIEWSHLAVRILNRILSNRIQLYV